MDITGTGAEAQKALFDKLGIRTATAAETDAARGSGDLGQDEFLKLLTVQMKNQDPFAPMDNGEFIAQMAQFSTVTGIRELSDTLTGMADEVKQFRVATSASMLGRSVLVPGEIARADIFGEVHGVLDLPQASIATSVDISDAATGEHLKTIELGGQASGLVGFAWTDLPEAYRDGSRRMKLAVTVNYGQGAEALQPEVYSRVIGAGTDPATGATTYELQDYDQVAAEDVVRFRL